MSINVKFKKKFIFNLSPSRKTGRCLYWRGCLNSNKYGMPKCARSEVSVMKAAAMKTVHR